MTDLAALQQENTELKEKLAQVQQQLDFLVRQVFGRKSEQTPVAAPGQLELELEAQEDDAIENAPPAQPAKRKGGSRKGRKMRAALLPENLPVEQTEIVPLAVQAAPEKWRRIGEEVTEKLERIPGKLIRLRVVRPTYVSIANPFAPPVTAPAPPQLIEGGFFGPHFIADLVLGKYLYHQPLYRQAKALQWECAVDLSPATLCQTIASVADAAGPVVACMSAALWRTGYVQVDLTPVRCLSREHKGGSFLGQMWVSAAVGGDVVYTWDKSKAALVAERIVPEWFRGLLQCDGGSELACFLLGGKGRHKPPPEILRAGCWAHVRRKFFEAAQSGCPIAAKLLKIINTLYRIEGRARENNFTPEQRRALRQRRAARVVKGLRRRIDRILQQVRPKSPAGKACLYALGQWESLLVYLDHGQVEIDNNSVENAIRPCALGKKNWLFIGDVGAGQRSATLYSLLGSCLRRAINPRAYLHWLITRLPLATNQTVHTLTPAAYAAAMQESAAGPAEKSA
jgi:transposase